MVTGVLQRVWRDVRENRKDKFVREFKDYRNWMEYIGIMSKEPMRELVLRLVWGAGDPRDFDSGTVAGRSSLKRPYASLVKNVVAFSRWRSIILWREVHCPRFDEMGDVS